MSEPERKRRRPAISCTLCRSRKIRCDRESPCSNCVKSRRGICVYEKLAPNKTPRRQNEFKETVPAQYPTPSSSISRRSPALDAISRSLDVNAFSASTLASRPLARDAELSENRIMQPQEETPFEGRNSTSSHGTDINASEETVKSQMSETCTIYKTRMYGQSHWMNSIKLFRDVYQGIRPHIQEEQMKAFSGIQKCKSLAKVIKAQRIPHWPSITQIELPSKDVSDELVECYLRTSEALYRVLHIPSFRRDYDALWTDNTDPDPAFLIQLKLVLAIGSLTYDDNFSLRTSANHWVHEAQNWLSKPDFKSRLNIQSLQTEILLLLARETVNVGGELVWISAGALFRTAVCMGLHRDPNHLSKKTIFNSEMRRRLWNTILEIVLQNSLISGSPPFFSLQDFDTQPPQNFDDDQLVAEDLAAEPESHFTQSSIAIAFRKTFSSRLAIVKYLNDLGSSSTYDETLRLDAILRSSYKTLRQLLQGYHSSTHSPSQFQIRALDMIISHTLCSLHVPFLGRAMQNTTYAFSRKVVLETILKVWCAAYPASSQTSSTLSPFAPRLDDLSRYALCGAGFFRTAAFQASHLIVVTLKGQLNEEESTGPVPLGPDLLSVLEDVKTWSLRMIRAGETNIKCYLLMTIILKQLKARMQARDYAEFGNGGSPVVMKQVIEEAEEICLGILKDVAARGGQANVAAEGLNCESSSLTTADGIDSVESNLTFEVMQDPDFIASDAMFNFDGAEQIGWLFGNGTNEWSTLW